MHINPHIILLTGPGTVNRPGGRVGGVLAAISTRGAEWGGSVFVIVFDEK